MKSLFPNLTISNLTISNLTISNLTISNLTMPNLAGAILAVSIAIMPLLIMLLPFATLAGEFTLRLAHNGPQTHPFHEGALVFKQRLESYSKGAVTVQIFPSEQLGSEEETTRMIQEGSLACAIESVGGGLAPFVPVADLFNLPFVFNGIDHFYRVVDGPVGQTIARRIEAKLDVQLLGWWFSGIRNTWNNKRPLNGPEDIEGLKIRVMGSPVLIDTFNALGAMATPMSFGKVYENVQKDIIDGAETDHVDLLVENFFEVTKYVALTEHMYLAAALICGNGAISQLPIIYQAHMRAAADAATRVQRIAMNRMANDALERLKEKGLEFNAVNIAKFRAAIRPVYQKNAERVGGIEMITLMAQQ